MCLGRGMGRVNRALAKENVMPQAYSYNTKQKDDVKNKSLSREEELEQSIRKDSQQMDEYLQRIEGIRHKYEAEIDKAKKLNESMQKKMQELEKLQRKDIQEKKDNSTHEEKYTELEMERQKIIALVEKKSDQPRKFIKGYHYHSSVFQPVVPTQTPRELPVRLDSRFPDINKRR